MRAKYAMRVRCICVVISTLIMISGCKKKPEPAYTNVYVNDYNILLVPDLSNRINPAVHPKPTNDLDLIYTILDHTTDLLKLQNRTTNVLDTYTLDFINRGILNENVVEAKDVELNFRRFKGKLLEASEYQRKVLEHDINTFKKKTKEVYDYALAHPSGSDIWNYFNETVIPKTLPEQGETTDLPGNHLRLVKKNRNVVVLFTDGYIENTNKTPGYMLNQEMIEQIRKAYKTSKATNLAAFIQSQPQFHIKPTENDLSDLHIIIFEMMDRSLDPNGVAVHHPTDFQILKVLWTKWLKDSGCKDIEIHQTFSRKGDAYERLHAFLSRIN